MVSVGLEPKEEEVSTQLGDESLNALMERNGKKMGVEVEVDKIFLGNKKYIHHEEVGYAQSQASYSGGRNQKSHWSRYPLLGWKLVSYMGW